MTDQVADIFPVKFGELVEATTLAMLVDVHDQLHRIDFRVAGQRFYRPAELFEDAHHVGHRRLPDLFRDLVAIKVVPKLVLEMLAHGLVPLVKYPRETTQQHLLTQIRQGLIMRDPLIIGGLRDVGHIDVAIAWAPTHPLIGLLGVTVGLPFEIVKLRQNTRPHLLDVKFVERKVMGPCLTPKIQLSTPHHHHLSSNCSTPDTIAQRWPVPS